MKLIYFLKNGKAEEADVVKKHELTKQGYRVTFSNGSIKGFEDSCDAVYCADDFPAVMAWAEAKGIEVVSDTKPEPEPEPEKPKRTRAPRKPKS